ncbi:hypothetical protein [Aromatoleum aromaticum]|uniref:hypothetical protein n=1 Tax=Aromatoleum aromaticum TaxID=551760 RepID=UPI0012FF25AA|nr:hypothetical protein [Aromatoleum aromaticum]NMG55835.1 hypothetical protein [Aromatoleum aromaticum]
MDFYGGISTAIPPIDSSPLLVRGTKECTLKSSFGQMHEPVHESAEFAGFRSSKEHSVKWQGAFLCKSHISTQLKIPRPVPLCARSLVGQAPILRRAR